MRTKVGYVYTNCEKRDSGQPGEDSAEESLLFGMELSHLVHIGLVADQSGLHTSHEPFVASGQCCRRCIIESEGLSAGSLRGDPNDFFQLPQLAFAGNSAGMHRAISARWESELALRLERGESCCLILTGGGGRDGLQALLAAMSAIDVFFDQHRQLIRGSDLLTLKLWTAHFWPHDGWIKALTQKLRGISFLDKYTQETGVNVQLKVCGLRECNGFYGKHLETFRAELRGVQGDVVGALFAESGADALLDLQAMFRVDAVDDAMQLYTLLEELPASVPLVYLQTNVGVDFRAFPEEQKFHHLLGAPVAYIKDRPVDVDKHCKRVRKECCAQALTEPHDSRANRMIAFALHCSQNGLPMDFPEATKMEFCSALGSPCVALVPYFVATFAHDPPQMATWRYLHELSPRLRSAAATYGDFLAALSLRRLTVSPRPPRPSASEPSDSAFALQLLAQLELAWFLYFRLATSAEALREIFRLPPHSPSCEATELLAGVFNSLNNPLNSRSMPQIFFLTQREASVLDILFWMLCDGGDGECVVRALLPWAGVPDGRTLDAAIVSIKRSSSCHLKRRPLFKVGASEVSPIAGEPLAVYEALVDALLQTL